jgi:hypothetical protein
VLAAAAAALAGCASGPGTYSLSKTRKCLVKAGLRLRTPSARADFVASLASGGAVAVALRRNALTVTFGKDSKEAERLAAGYRRGGAFATVTVERNAVLVWTTPPSSEQSQQIEACLE